jgi:ElaB/YqjD/DUF883 family membrane-anchored ribosome-binding protein
MFSVSKGGAAAEPANGRDLTSFTTRASGLALEAEGQLSGAAEFIKTVVTNRPVLALGAALAAGVFLGWLIKRR